MLIPTPANTKTVSDMRQNPVGLLNTVAKSAGPSYIFHRSTPKAVLLNISHYELMLEMIEDYQDSMMVQEFEKEDKSKIAWVTGREMRNRLGLLKNKKAQALSRK